MELIKASDKKLGEINQEWVDKAIKKVNNEVNQPCTVNIGRHLMNSDTQDYIEKMLLDAGYTVIRTTDGLARYSVLKVTWGKRV